MAEKKTNKSKAPAKKTKAVPRIKDLSPKKNPRGGDRGHQFPSGGGSSDE